MHSEITVMIWDEISLQTCSMHIYHSFLQTFSPDPSALALFQSTRKNKVLRQADSNTTRTMEQLLLLGAIQRFDCV